MASSSRYMALVVSSILVVTSQALQIQSAHGGVENQEYDYCHELQVGPSESKMKTVSLPSAQMVCPQTVTKLKWLGTETYDDIFHVHQDGQSVSVVRFDGDQWGMNLRFKCCARCATLDVGSSKEGTILATLPSENYVCPAVVDRDNWIGGQNYGDVFKTSQSGASVSVTRKDAPGNGWGMQLRFRCCRPQAPKLPACLFLHGAMVKGAWPPQFKTWYGDVAGALRTYWGPFNTWYADLCSEFIYSEADTETHAWDDTALQIAYADKAAEVVAVGGIVFAHSMANAILAGACWRLGKCPQWYSLGGGYSGQAIGSGILKAVHGMGPVGANIMNTKVYAGFNFEAHGMRHDPEANSRNAMAKVVDNKKLLKGSICGVLPGGAGKETKEPDWLGDFSQALERENKFDQHLMGVAMWAASTLVVQPELEGKGEDTRSDGLVEVASCAYWKDESGQSHWYGTGTEWPTVGANADAVETHILAAINHIEECGVFPGASVAANWMRNMMCRELQLSGTECPSISLGREAAGAAPHADPVPAEWPAPTGEIGEACSPPFHNCNSGHCCIVNGLHSMCQHKQRDWLGVEWCPLDCEGAPGFKGTCANEEFTSLMHRPRKLGEPCLFESDCENWISAEPVGCCDKVCTRKKKDWAQLYWCPAHCAGTFWGSPGTC